MTGDTRVVIVGAGFGGIAAAIELQRHGFTDLTILEAAPGLGGTWLHNSYPGAACDVPSHLYSFSFAQRRDWTRLCSPQPEILAYLREVAAEYGVDRLVRPDTTVTSCSWDDATRRWSVATADGETIGADALVIATGQLNRPAIPALPGLPTFTGHTFHSARWDHDHDLRGRRVAVVGTGASAVQFIPEIAPQVQRLVVFQRTANWFLQRKNRAYPAWIRWANRSVPGLQAWRRIFMFLYCESLTAMIRYPRTVGRLGHLRAASFMRLQLRDPDVRRKAWPDYTFGCKRVLFSSYFLPALQRDDVDLVTDPIVRVTPTGIVTADGAGTETEHEVDTIIWGTGFRASEFMFPMKVTGAAGASLADVWAGGAHAHLGMTVPGFPSMFVMYGPNTNTSGGSIVGYLEAQAAYIRQALQHVRARGAGAIDVRPDVEARSDHEVQAAFAGTAWTRCDSWYRVDSGRVVANWPRFMSQYLEATARLDPAEYEFLT
ncbi:MAG: flavin-containing monooxygenase [Pseudonocardia sp.]